MKLGESLEDYLETIYILYKKQGYVRSVDVARYMNFSKPSVSHAVKELKNKGYLEMGTDCNLCLTEEGAAFARQIYERHCFFTEALISAGVNPELAEADACRLEHTISDESYQKLKEMICQALGEYSC